VTRTANAFLAISLLSLTILAAGPRPAQALPPSPQPAPQTADQQNPRSRNAEDVMMQDVLKRQAKAANLKRQGDLKRDTDRLLQLATDLKLQVDKSNENILSLTVIRKAEEIEKLAHSVKEKMKANN
jgi:hypothetical protein